MPLRTRDHDQPHVVVVGAGYAGIHAALAARRHGADVTVVDATGMHEFGTRLAGVAGGRAPSGDGWAPVEDLTGLDVERAWVAGIDGAGPALILEDATRETADAIVVATGAATRIPDVPGVREHALSLKTVADALAIRRELVEATRLIVVGGGPTGVQLAGEAANRHRHLDVTVIEAADRLLPAMPGAAGERALHLLRRRNVDVRRSSSVQRVTADGVVLASGSRLDGIVVWATGYEADGSALMPDADTLDGRLVVDGTLRVPGTVGVFAAGDVAAHTDVFGRPLPMSAQTAVRAGTVAGRNAARAANGLPSSPALLLELGRLVTLGRNVGVGTLGPIPLANPLLDGVVARMHDAVDARHLWQVGGLKGVLAHLPGRHRPGRADLRRIERPQVRSVG